MKRPLNKLLLFIAFAFLVSCSNTKYLKKSELLYVGAKINLQRDSLSKKQANLLETNLKEQLMPEPNKSFLGLRPKLYFYNITSEPKKEKGFKYWLKYKVGEKPVLLSDVDIDFNRKIIENYSENLGYFNVSTSYDTVTKNKKTKVIYNVKPRQQYLIEKVTFQKDSTLINSEIQKIAAKSLLKVGAPFNLNVIKAERERIDSYLKENGFYYFHPDNIIVQADSTVNNHKVDLIVKLKESTPAMATKQFTIDKIVVIPDYNLRNLGRRSRVVSQTPIDSLTPYKGIYIIDREEKFKPQIYDRTLYFKKGDLYNRTDHNLSLNRLINLGTFKFVKNQFVISDSLNNKFDVYYMLTPNEFKSLRLETLGKTNSASYAGGEVNFNWRHRNFLKGAELFTASLYGAMDYQIGGRGNGNNIYRVGSKFSLAFPRIIAPFKFTSSSAFVPRTKIGLGYEYQSRTQLYTLHNFNASFGYLWKEDVKKEHELNVLEVTYVFPEKITEKYKEQMADNPSLARIVEKQLIFGPTYSYTFTNTMLPLKHTVYYKGQLDLSANLTGLISGANYEKGQQKEILGVAYSQYVKTEHDIRYYLKLNEKSQFAARFIAGYALPYGNSEYMPFSKQFFVGGSNSIRAFRARTLGPGSYDPRTQTSSFLMDQAGDIKLEFNAEYRANLFSFLNAALFVDAGNVWLMRDDPTKPGGKFSNEFLSEVAVGVGAGLRFDFSILVLRTDLSIPVRVPYYEKNDRWRFDHIEFGDRAWRKDNLILNIAIGYPF